MEKIEKKIYTRSEFLEAWDMSNDFFYKFIKKNPGFPLMRYGRKIVIPIRQADDYMSSLINQR